MRNLLDYLSSILWMHDYAVAIARKTSEKSPSNSHGNRKEKFHGPSFDFQAPRTKSMDEVMGIEALEFGLGIGEIVMPKLSILQLQKQSTNQHTFNEWLMSIHDNSVRKTATTR